MQNTCNIEDSEVVAYDLCVKKWLSRIRSEETYLVVTKSRLG